MKKIVLLLTFVFILANAAPAGAAEYMKIEVTPAPCNSGAACPVGLSDIYKNSGEKCAANLDEFKSSPNKTHYWVEDPEITAQGKANERARQFIYWTLNNNAVDNSPVITKIWNTTRNITYFFVIFMAAVMGIGMIIGQRFQFYTKVKVWPSIMKVAGSLIIITFSAVVVLLFIQLSEILMRFFIENLGGRDLFNIYFASNNLSTSATGAISGSNETNYVNFVGCRDLNMRVNESVGTELMMFKLTNLTYYVMGTMIILRKIVLWFLLIVSPFLAVLLPFVFIRNIGIIWIGVFLQWLFYGPLFAIFIGAVSTIWKLGIPFGFNFSRAGTTEGYVYPTATNIIYGGPAQTLSILNSSSYIDTYVEYIITLIMLWAAIWFPWWLLRIFRDYCCDAINASKNVLLSMYDQMRAGGIPPQPTPVSPVSPSSVGSALKMPREVEVPVSVRLHTMEEIHSAQTREILRSINISAANLAEIAEYETNKKLRETVRQNIEQLQNPLKAENQNDRQRFMNIRTELFNRAVKDDALAKRALAGISSSRDEQLQRREELAKSLPKRTSYDRAIATQLNVPVVKINSIEAAVSKALQQRDMIDRISHATLVPPPTVQKILSALWRTVDESTEMMLDAIAKEAGVEKDKVLLVATHTGRVIRENKELIREIAEREKLKEDDVIRIFELQTALKTEPAKNVEKTISIPQTVSIEDYENVKKMWQKHYEQGDIPLSDTIRDRNQWINHDIVFITNTLNKLTAKEEEQRMTGIGDVGYILPVFMINNFTPEELLVYLRAKLEAAKTVQDQVQKEAQLRQDIEKKSDDEMFVEIEHPKKQEDEEKTMEMKKERSTSQ